jgi:hypothetical protein
VSFYIITYDERQRTRDYQPLYDALDKLGAAHLQNSVWLLDRSTGTAESIHNHLKTAMHPDDTLCLIELPNRLGDWCYTNVRKAGGDWLRAHS